MEAMSSWTRRHITFKRNAPNNQSNILIYSYSWMTREEKETISTCLNKIRLTEDSLLGWIRSSLKIFQHTYCHVWLKWWHSGLCSRSAWVPQVTNLCLWAPRKTYFFHISLSTWHPGFHGWEPSALTLHFNFVTDNKVNLYFQPSHDSHTGVAK